MANDNSIDSIEKNSERQEPASDSAYRGRYWHYVEATGSQVTSDVHGKQQAIYCDLCPRACVLKDGDRGFCFVRKNEGGEMILTTYGSSTGFCIDPIEKK